MRSTRLALLTSMSDPFAVMSSSSSSGATQHRMVALPRRVFERGGDVPGFEQRQIRENLLAAGAGGQQVEHIADADAQTTQAGAPATLAWIDGDTVRLAHRGSPELNSMAAS